MTCRREGNTVVLRNLARSDGTVTTAIPAGCLADTERSLTVYIAKGTPFKNNYAVPAKGRVDAVTSSPPSAGRKHETFRWWHPTVRLYLPNTFYSVSFSYDERWRLASFYGNLEAPFVRTPIGIDTRDYALDVVATPDGRWFRKDEAEFARRLEVGIDSAEHQARVRAAGRDFVRRFEQNAFPFSRGWRAEVPKNAAVPELPAAWAQDYGTHGILSAYAA